MEAMFVGFQKTKHNTARIGWSRQTKSIADLYIDLRQSLVNI